MANTPSSTPSIPSLPTSLVSTTNHSFSVKLTPKNYLAWKTQFRPILNYQNLEGIIDGTVPEPPSETPSAADPSIMEPNPDYAIWFRKDQMLLSWIFASLTEEIFPYVIGLKSSQEVWKALEQSFGALSQNRQLQLHIELQSLKKDDLTVSQFLNKAKALADELSAAGKPLSPAEFNAIIYRNIGADYHSIITSLNIRPEPVSFYELHGQLVAHEVLLQSLSHPQANMVVRNSSASSFSNTSDATNRTRNNGGNRTNQSGGNRPRGPCQICNGRNHTANVCRRRFQRNYSGQSGQFVQSQPRPYQARPFNPQANYVAAPSPLPQQPRTWYPDTAANYHITPDLQSLSTYSDYNGNDNLQVGNGNGLQIAHTGNATLPSASGSFRLHNVLHVPQIIKPLLSVQKFTNDNSCFFEFWPTFFAVKDQRTRKVLMQGPSEDGVYALRFSKQAMTATVPTMDDWHVRLGHPNRNKLSALVKSNLISSSSHNLQPCSSCLLGKLSRIPLVSVEHKSSSPFQIIHSDVWGPAPVKSFHGHSYFVLFVDDYTRFTWVYFLKHKSDVYNTFLHFEQMVTRQFNTTIRAFHSDWGGEYQKLNKYFTSTGIIHRIACPYTHEQNGIAERKIRHLVDTTLTLLAHANLPKRFWNFALEQSAMLINVLPSHVIHQKSPYQMLYLQHPKYSIFKPFGCAIFPLLRPYNKNKFSFRSVQCVNLGLSPNHCAFRCLDVKTNRVYLARHVKLHETIFPYADLSSLVPVSRPIQEPWITITSADLPSQVLASVSSSGNVSSPLSSTSQIITPTSHSHAPTLPSSPILTRTPQAHLPVDTSPTNVGLSLLPLVTTDPVTPAVTPPIRTHPMLLRPNPKPKKFAYVINTKPNYLVTEPKSVKQAIPYAEWRVAMQEELSALTQNQTWSLVPRPLNKNVIGNRWIFRIKRHADGTIDRYKARLVAKGYSQQCGIDYQETFSPVIKFTTVRTILSLAVSSHWSIKQIDISNAFLHGFLHEEVYMEQPTGFKNSSFPEHVCKLQRSLYGLKQAPRQWFMRLTTFLLSLGFKQSKADNSLFYLCRGSLKFFILIYVDDIILTCSNSHELQNIIQKLGSVFPVKDLGDLHYFLGIQVSRINDGLLLSQEKYLEGILSDHNMAAAKPFSTPMPTTPNLSKLMGEKLSDATCYRQVIGTLQYMTLTRPDIAFSVNKLAQFMHSPTILHWQAVKRLLRYLRGTSTYGLFITPSADFQLHCFSDSDWGGCPDDRRSTGGYLIYFGRNLVSWSSKKQPTVARSSTESEYKALANAAAEALWLRSLLCEIGYGHKLSISLWCDNIGAVYLSSNPVLHSRTKHVALDYHFVREQVQNGTIAIRFISSADQIADILTKPLAKGPFLFLRDKLRLRTSTPSA